MRGFARLFATVSTAARGWMKHSAARLAAALSFYTAISLAPLLTMILFVAGMVWGDEAASGYLVEQIGNLTDRQAAAFIQTLIAKADRPAIGSFAGAASFLVLAWGSTKVFSQLQLALDVVWEVEDAAEIRMKVSRFAKQRLAAFGMTLAVAFLLLVSLVLDAVVSYLADSTRLLGDGWFWGLANALVSLALVVLLFALMYKVLPTAKVQWRHALFGAGLSAIPFSLGKVALGLYLGRQESIFGASGSLVAILIWVYFSAQVLFFGAELAKACAESGREERASA